jgi:capsular exopolysaccharide synthesis family protein
MKLENQIQLNLSQMNDFNNEEDSKQHNELNKSSSGAKNENQNFRTSAFFIALEMLLAFVLGLLGEVLPDSIKSALSNFAEFFGLSYGQFWIACVVIILLLAIIFTILRELRSNTKRIKYHIKTSEDVSLYLNLHTLAEIPLFKLAGKSNYVGTSNCISLYDSRSSVAEAYRHLRTSLLNTHKNNRLPQSILVASPLYYEGKTTTAINIAVTIAQIGEEVVIIDCNFRRPRIHQHFNMDNTQGLTNYLSGETGSENLLKSLPQLPNLKIITSGQIPGNPSELLSSREMKALLQFLHGNFKHIIVDSPPAISYTDASVLSTLVDGVIIVVLAGKSYTQTTRRFIFNLQRLGSKIFGVVLNGSKTSNYYYLDDQHYFDDTET